MLVLKLKAEEEAVEGAVGVVRFCEGWEKKSVEAEVEDVGVNCWCDCCGEVVVEEMDGLYGVESFPGPQLGSCGLPPRRIDMVPK